MVSEKTARKIDNARINMKITVALSDLSASEISQRAGLSVNVLGKYLRGETMISFANIQAVCDVLDIPLTLITSERQITPARIRLIKAISKLSDEGLEAFMKSATMRELDG
jgi:transcriptional regulator with XRE-family HTH domain